MAIILSHAPIDLCSTAAHQLEKFQFCLTQKLIDCVNQDKSVFHEVSILLVLPSKLPHQPVHVIFVAVPLFPFPLVSFVFPFRSHSPTNPLIGTARALKAPCCVFKRFTYST
jgi:hypothetical protein